MRAVALCLIDEDVDNTSTRLEEVVERQTKLRILDLTPNVAVKVFDYPLYKVKTAIKKDKLHLDGIKLSKRSKLYGLSYYGKRIEDILPVLHTSDEEDDTRLLLKIQDYGNDKLFALIANVYGEVEEVELCELIDTYIRSIPNIQIEPVVQKAKPGYVCINLAYSKYTLEHLDGSKIEIEKMEPMLKLEVARQEQETPVIAKAAKTTNDRLFTEWLSISDYIDEIRERGYSWKFTVFHSMDELDSLDDEIVTVPYGVYEILGTSPTINKAVKTLRISSTVEIIKINALKNYEALEEIVYQEATGKEEYQDIDGRGFQGSGLLEFIARKRKGMNIADLIPSNTVKLQYMAHNVTDEMIDCKVELCLLRKLKFILTSFNEIQLDSKVMLPDAVEQIIGSFNNCIYSGDMYIPSRVYTISQSFVNLDMGSNKYSNIPLTQFKNVEFSPNSVLTEIEGSFVNSDIEVLDLRNTPRLSRISRSFLSCKNLRKVIFSEYAPDINIFTSFRDCPLLSEIVIGDKVNILTKGVKEIEASFVDTSIDHIMVPPETTCRISYCFNDNTVIEIGSTKLRFSFYEGKLSETNKVKILDTVKVLEPGSFSGEDLELFDFSEASIHDIFRQSFVNCKGKLFNMFNWEVRSLPQLGFKLANIECLILPKNLKVIEQNCFLSASINKILMPENLESIERGAFSSISSRNRMTLYIVKGSKTSKLIRKKNFFVKEFDTLKEAYDAIFGVEYAASEKDKLRAKLVLSNVNDPTVSEFSSGKYLENVTLFTEYYRILNSNSFNPAETNVKLDMSKLRRLFKVQELANIIDDNCTNYFTSGEMNLYSGVEKVRNCDLTNAFKVLCNYITRYTTKAKFLLNVNNIRRLFSTMYNGTKASIGDSKCSLIYKDDYSSISTIMLPESRIARDGCPYITFICIGDSVVYVTSEFSEKSNNDDFVIKHFSFIVSLAGLSDLAELDKTVKVKPRDILNIGTGAIVRSPIAFDFENIQFPLRLGSELVNEFKKSLLVISADSSVKGTTMIRFLMSLADGTVFRVKSSSSENLFNLAGLKQFKVEKVYDSMYDASKELDKMVIGRIFKEDADGALEQLCDTTRIKIELMARDDAYDKLEPCLEYKISRNSDKLGLSNIENMHYKIAELILSTGFFNKTVKRGEDLAKMLNWSEYENYTLADGSKVVCLFNQSKRTTKAKIIGLEQRYITYILGANDTIDKTITCYTSYHSFFRTVNDIIRLYSANTVQVDYVDDVIYRKGDFFICGVTSDDYLGWTLAHAISRKTGYNYLIAIYNIEAVLLFRLKDTNSGLTFIYDYNTAYISRKSKIIPEGFVGDCARFAQYLSVLKRCPSNETFELRDLRKFITNGAPNGLIFNAKYNRFLELVARQPKQQ